MLFAVRGRSYIARYALGEGGGQPFYRKTYAGGGSTKLSHISHEKEKSDEKQLKGERKKKGEKSCI